MTIAEILRKQRSLVPERRALTALRLRATRANREWLTTVLPFELVLLPRQVPCYRYRDIIRLRDNLQSLAKQLPPEP